MRPTATAADLSRDPAAPLEPGAEIAPGYGVIAHMRRGNDLDVYDAWSEERRARCIVKTTRPDREDVDRVRRAVLREGALLERLTHPHIVRAYETLTTPAPVVVLETLTGQTLAHLIETADAVARDEIAQLGLQLGSALHYLHAHRILHLDLKPSNVIAEGPRAKLIDLSLARPPGEARPGIGTWHYLSPEQARGDLLTEAADIWGLGATLFEAATGEAPFDDDPAAWPSRATPSASSATDAQAERYPQLEHRARRAADVAPVDPQLAAAIDACLEPDPGERPSLDQLTAGLEPLA
jgi:eukaryotic-like serine/threonine-protein kinase